MDYILTISKSRTNIHICFIFLFLVCYQSMGDVASGSSDILSLDLSIRICISSLQAKCSFHHRSLCECLLCHRYHFNFLRRISRLPILSSHRSPQKDCTKVTFFYFFYFNNIIKNIYIFFLIFGLGISHIVLIFLQPNFTWVSCKKMCNSRCTKVFFFWVIFGCSLTVLIFINHRLKKILKNIILKRKKKTWYNLGYIHLLQIPITSYYMTN